MWNKCQCQLCSCSGECGYIISKLFLSQDQDFIYYWTNWGIFRKIHTCLSMALDYLIFKSNSWYGFRLSSALPTLS